jgi:hypothetical protein
MDLFSSLKEPLGDRGGCPQEPSRHVARILIDIAGHLPRRHVRTGLHLKRTNIAVELGGSITEYIAVLHSSSAAQHLVVRTDVDVSSFVPAKVGERAVIALAGIANRDVRRDPSTDQLA